MTAPVHPVDACVFLGAVAVELVAGHEPPRLRLPARGADTLADGIANDLARLVPASAGLDLALALALFDPAELLRPAWPVHAALARLTPRAPGAAGGRVLAFGASDGRMPEPALEPAAALAGGPLRLLPWVLHGAAADIAAVGAQLEDILLERGMAAAATALALQEAFGVPLEHVRHATIHDLCALTAAQYRHAALVGTWEIIEDALLHARHDRFSAADGPPLLAHPGGVLLGTLDRAAWEASGLAPEVADPATRSRAFAYWSMRERQLRAVLESHGLAVREVPLATLPNAHAHLQSAIPL